MTRPFYIRIERHRLDRVNRKELLVWLSDRTQIDVWLRQFLSSNRIRFNVCREVWEIIPKRIRRK